MNTRFNVRMLAIFGVSSCSVSTSQSMHRWTDLIIRFAVVRSHLEVVQLLLNRGANPDATDNVSIHLLTDLSSATQKYTTEIGIRIILGSLQVKSIFNCG